MIKVSNVLFVLFLFCFATSKQLQGQTLPLKESKQKIAEMINEMIPKETREALEKEGLLEKNFTKEVFSTVVDDMTSDGLLAQAKHQKTQEKKKVPKLDLKTCKEATELIEYVLSDNDTEQSEEYDKNGETAVIKTYIITTIKNPEQEEYPQEPEDLPTDDKKEQVISQSEKPINTTQDIEIQEPLQQEQNKTQPQIPIEQPQFPSQPRPRLSSPKPKRIRKLN